MPGWLSWLERTAHRVLSKCSDFFLGYREAAGSNPAPGTSRFISGPYFVLYTIFILIFKILKFFWLQKLIFHP